MQFVLQKYEQIFKHLDQDNKGFIDMDQLFYAVTHILKIDMDKTTLEVMMNLTDDNNDGVTQENEFCHFIYICENADFKDTKSILFYAADDDYSGTIDKFELLKIIKKLHINMNENDVFNMVKALADNDDQSLSYNMFLQVMDNLIKVHSKKPELEIVQNEPSSPSGSNVVKKSKVNHIVRLKNQSISFI
ncbi:EF_hand domain-containing protein [Hexamita inflata]|uniref:EF hand domain-containing protein n=1 Tax=Hexamita inflata TaxID=28002 RepID=A0AA86P023_9EUKA|nr:EF hand domain-containing protein [Hexamita inflata]